MSLVGFKGKNHPQQVGVAGANDEVDDRGTPAELWDKLNDEFGFTLDVAAAEHNHKTPHWFGRKEDGLARKWDGVVWCNPPYSNIGDWVRKAWVEIRRPGVSKIVMLLPANRTEQAWWQEEVELYRDNVGGPLRVRFLPGRIRFIQHGRTEVGPNERPPFGNCLLIWSKKR